MLHANITAVHDLVPSQQVPCVRQALRRVLADADTVDVAVAFVTDSGVQALRELFAEFGAPSRARIVVRGGPISDPDAVVALSHLGAEVRVVLGTRASRFHPKLWIVGTAKSVHVLSGSGNLTAGGLDRNYEQFEFLHLPLPDVDGGADAHRRRWDAFFALGSPLADAVTSPWWAEWSGQQSRRRQLTEELARLDRQLVDTPAPAPAEANGDDLEWLRGVLQEAVGERYAAEVSKPRWGRRAEVNVGEDRGVKYLFLMPDDSKEGPAPTPSVCLRLYPGDTLGQARQFYSRMDERGRDRLIALDTTLGWSVEPNFHLGFWDRGWLHDRAPAGVLHYLDYWRACIDEHHQLPAEEWPAILERLAAERIVSASYPERFLESIGRRRSVHPRPGLVITRSWSLVEAEQLDRHGQFAHAVRSAVDHALAVIEERPLDR